jgi:GNAT superfamily N-acetyltransferase
MEVDLRRWRRPPIAVRSDYRFLSWSPDLIDEHAEVKYLSFRDELDAAVFPCLGELESCQRLMHEISERDGFTPEATWLAIYAPLGAHYSEPCGTIQAIRVHRGRANIQNIGVTPQHRGMGVGAGLIIASLTGLLQIGVTRVALEVTAENDVAVRLYRRLGFRVVKTLYKAADEPVESCHPAAH